MEQQRCDSQDSPRLLQTVSRNATQNTSQAVLQNVSEANTETGRSLCVPHDMYGLQPSNALSPEDNTIPLMSTSNTASQQQRSPLPAVAGQNNCYLLYLNMADSAQVMVPVAMGVSGIGIKVSNEQPPQTSDAREHQSPSMAGLRAPVSVSPLAVSSAYVQSDGVPAGQSQDKSRPPVAVVVPWTSIASSYPNNTRQSTDEQMPGQEQRNSLMTSSAPSVMIYQTVNNQTVTVQSQNATKHSVLPQNLGQQLAIEQGFIRVPSQQGGQLRLTQPLGSQPLVVQQGGSQQLLAQTQSGCLQQENHLQPSPRQQGVFLQTANRGNLQRLTLPFPGGQRVAAAQGNSQQLQQANNRPQLISQDGLQQPSNCPSFIPQNSHQQLTAQRNSLQQLAPHNQQLAFQPGSHQQLLALQLGAGQSLMSRQAASQQLTIQQACHQQAMQRPTNTNPLLSSQRLSHSQAVHQRLNVVPTLTPADALSRGLLIQQGIPQQLAVQGNQQLALLLRNCSQVPSARLPAPNGSPESAKLQQDSGQQMLTVQQNNYQLTELQQRILQRSNCQQLGELPRVQQMLNRPPKQENSSCMQLKQQQMQQQQILQQQLQQSSSCLYRMQEGVGMNQSVKEEIKIDLSHFPHENREYNMLHGCVSDAESNCHDATRSQTVTSRNELPQSCKEEPNSASKFMDQSRNFGFGGSRFGFSPSTSDNEQIIRNSTTQANRFPSHSLEQLSHQLANRAQFVNASGVQQNSNPKGPGFTASPNFGCNIPGQGTGMNEQNQLQLVSKQDLQSCGMVIACSPRHQNSYNLSKTLDVRNLNINAQAVTNIESANYILPQSVDMCQPKGSEIEQGKNAADGNPKAGQNKATEMGNGLPSNNYRPSTVLQLRLPHLASSSYVAAAPHNDNTPQLQPLYYSSPVAVSRFPQSRLPGYILPVQQNSISSSAKSSISNSLRLHNGSVTTATPCISIPSYQVSAQPELIQTSSGVAATPDLKGQELLSPSRQMGVARVFINVAHPSSGVNSLSPTDILAETAGQTLEVGQECELRYVNGPRLTTIWDGKYFKLKRPLHLNHDADPTNMTDVRMLSVKGGGLAPKDGQESAPTGSGSESRPTISDSVTSLAHQETDGCNSLTASLARPPLHPATEEQSKSPGSALPAQPSSSSVSATAKRPREEGKFAICKHCGAHSCDFDRCDQCHRDLPPDVKIYDPVKKQRLNPTPTSLASADAVTKKQSQKTGVQTHGLKRAALEQDGVTVTRTPSTVKASQSSKKTSAKQNRKQETEVVHILSSDDDEEEDEDPLGSASKKSTNEQMSSGKNKARKSMSESVANCPELKPGANCQQLASSGQTAESCVVQRFAKLPELSVLTFDTLRVFFGFIRHEKKCFLTLDQTTVSLQPVVANEEDPVIIRASEIQMVAGHVNPRRCLTCLFVLITAEKAADLRKSLSRDVTTSFNPDSTEDCAKYVVLFLTEQRSNFLGNVEHMVFQMRIACGSDKPHYKQIDTFDVDKYLQNVCPGEDIQNFMWKSGSGRRSSSGGAGNAPGEPKRSQENDEGEEDMDYGSRSPSPVHVLFSGQIIKLFTYPPPPATGGISVTNEDLFCLNEGEFLNDVIIDFYLKYLMTDFLSEKFHRTHVFSSFFYRRLTQKLSRRHKEEEDSACTSPQQRRHSRIRTWTRHVDLFEKDFIIVPINESAHWYLAIICYPGLIDPEIASRPVSDDAGNATLDANTKNDGKKTSKGRSRTRHENVEKAGANDEPSQNPSGRKGRGRGRKAAATPTKPKSEQYVKKMPCILIFDSLAGPGRTGVIRILREYLQVEWDVKKKDLLGPRIFTKDNMKGTTPECPQQSNFSDCGIYVLQYVESFFTDPIQDFTFPIKLMGKWFDEEKIKNKRAGLQQLILDMQKQYNPTLDFSPEKDGCVIKRDQDETSETVGASSQSAPV